MKKTRLYKAFRYVLLILIAVSVFHAFYQSSLSQEESKSESDKVGEIIEEIIPPETPSGNFVKQNLRKLAHFTEFMIIGFFCVLYTVFYMKTKVGFSLLAVFGLIVALLDETVQILSSRGPSVTDVWIDYAGYAASLVIVLAIYFAACAIIWLKRRSKEGV